MDVERFARMLGYMGAKRIGQWKSYDVYEPFMDPDLGIPVTGIPVFILSQGSELRTSAVDESFRIMDNLDRN